MIASAQRFLLPLLFGGLLFLAGLSSTAVAGIEVSAAPAVSAPDAARLWNFRPGEPNRYINSVSVSDDGERILAGTYYFDYSRKPDPDYVPPLGNYGTYLLDRHGKLVWKDEFVGHQGVYWTALSRSGRWAASTGWYSNAPKTGFVSIYDADNGRKIVDFKGASTRVTTARFSPDEKLLMAASDTVYLFPREGKGYAAMPIVVELPIAANSDNRPNKVTSIASSHDGRYIVAATIKGQVVYIRRNGDSAEVIGQFRTEGPIRSLDIAADTDFVVVNAGRGVIYGFALQQLVQGKPPNWVARFENAAATFSVDITDDGSRVAAVANIGSGGRVGLLDNTKNPGTWLWQTAIAHNPNSVSISADGKQIAVADGFPNGAPGGFTLFDGSSGAIRWQHASGDMSWPIRLSAKGDLCVAGSDDGLVYAFPVQASPN